MKEEWVPLVDEKGIVTGKAPRSQVHDGSKKLHPVVHLHVLHDNLLLLQKRPESKFVQPGKWDTAVGGHVSWGESIEQALKKEAFEELGLSGFLARLIQMYRWDSEIESELVYLFLTTDAQRFVLQTNEVEEASYLTKIQIEEQLGKGIFTPNFEFEYHLLKKNGLF